jgi:hypothetical protein
MDEILGIIIPLRLRCHHSIPISNLSSRFLGVYSQPDPMVDPRKHDPSAFGHPHFNARHGSHSRPRQESEHNNRRESVDSDRIRRKEVRKIGEILETELRDEVRREIRDALREAAAEDKVRRWPTGGSYPPTTSSSQSMGQDDVWSGATPSDGRSYGHGTPDTSPDRGERFYRSRPIGSIRNQDSSGSGSNRSDGTRYYQDREYVLKPHDSQPERYRDYERGRSLEYVQERREAVGDYPNAQYHRQQQREEPRIYVGQRPRVQRRVTDFPDTLYTGDFGRRNKDSVDFADRSVYEDHEERHSGREAVIDDDEITDFPGLAKGAEEDLSSKGDKAGNGGEEGDKE